MLKIKGWSRAHDEADVSIIETVTRCQDPTNNSNKYRRFISVWAPGERPHFFTHTGRWTVECDSGFWNNVGTYRPGELLRTRPWAFAVRQAGNVANASAHLVAHDQYVTRKLGEYKITRASQNVSPNNANVKTWLKKGEAVESTNGTPTLVTTPTTPAPTTPLVQPMSAKPAPTRLAGWDSSPIMSRVQNVLQRSAAEGADPFDVMADVATLRGEITASITELQSLADDLGLANTNAMERI